MPRIAQVLAALVVLGAACGDDGAATAPPGDTAASTSTTTVTEMPVEPEPGATFGGPFEAQPGLTGTISFEISMSGAQVVSVTAELHADGYQCDGGTVSGGFATTVEPVEPIPIQDGVFDLDWDTVKWHGTFDSATSAQGTFWLIDQGCEYGPMTWVAESP